MFFEAITVGEINDIFPVRGYNLVMGVSDLRELSVIEETELKAYRNETVAVDAHHWLFRYMTVQVRYMSEEYYTTSDGVEIPNLMGMLRGLPTVLDAGVTPVFVFDGTPESLKQDEIEARKASKEEAKEKLEAAREEGDVDAARRYKAQSQSLTAEIHETSRELLRLLGIPYVEADGAGEGYAARLTSDDQTPVSAAFTGDYDSLLFGSPETVRSFSGDDGVERIKLGKTLADLELTHEQLVDAAILIGTDYNRGVSGIGPKRAVEFVNGDRSTEEIAQDWGANELTGEKINAIRDIFLSPPTGESIQREGLQDPDFDAAYDFLVGEWELPSDSVKENFDRFPRY